jgi:site-specific DNA-cytosine methylase
VLQEAGHSNLLAFEHVMSCEIEPFKQAFLARNYPGAELLPDIRELVPKDVRTHVRHLTRGGGYSPLVAKRGLNPKE